MEKWLKEFKKNAQELEIHEYGIVPVEKLVFSDGVRKLCEMNSCGGYGMTWCCPPGVGTLKECRAKIEKYKSMLVFTTKHLLEDSYDYDGMMQGKNVHEMICERVVKMIQENTTQEMLILSAEGCAKCEKCTYPDKPCRFPDKLFPSVESYGVEVNRLAQEADVKYINGVNTVTYFAGICF